MKHVVRSLLSLALAVVVASPLLAAQGEEGKKRTRPKPQDPASAILKSLEKAELTEEQVAKVKEMAAEVAEKAKALQEKAALTPEQKKARQEARAKAQAEGKAGKEAVEATLTAMNLSDDQKAAVLEEMALRAGLRKQVIALLTAEQKEKAGIKGPKKRGNR